MFITFYKIFLTNNHLSRKTISQKTIIFQAKILSLCIKMINSAIWNLELLLEISTIKE